MTALMIEHEEHDDDAHTGESVKVTRDRQREARRTQREHEDQDWSRDDFHRDLRRAAQSVDRPHDEESP
jgi:hypothetical protein